MNIQIYSDKKNFDTQKALRFFKERKIKVQQVDLGKKGLSRGELASLIRAVGLEQLIDSSSKAYQSLNLSFHGLSAETEALLLQHPELLKTPIVRNGRQATIGYCPDVWLSWD